MGLLRMTIGTRDVQATDLVDFSLDIELEAHKHGTCRAVVVDRNIGQEADAYRPTEGDDVTITDDNVTVFGGVLQTISEEGITSEGGGVKTAIVAVTYDALLEVVRINEPIAAGTFLSQVTALFGPMATHGFTMATGQPDGPDMPAFLASMNPIRKYADYLMETAQWEIVIGFDKTVSIRQPGTTAAPFNINEAFGDVRFQNLKKERSLSGRVNRVWVGYGPQGPAEGLEIFEGDGLTKTFTLAEYVLQMPVTQTVEVTRSGPIVSTETLDLQPSGGPAQWHLDLTNPAAALLIQDAAQTTLLDDETVSIKPIEAFPNYVSAPAAGIGSAAPFEIDIPMPETTDRSLALARAEAELRIREGSPNKVTCVVFDPGLIPLQTIQLEIPSRLLSGSFLVTRVRYRPVQIAAPVDGLDTPDYVYAYEFDALEGNERGLNWVDFWRVSTRTSGSAGVSPVAQVPTSVHPAAFPVVWSDDFESATALSVDYTTTFSPAKVAGVGVGGSKGLQGGWVRRTVALQGREGIVSVDVKPTAGNQFSWVISLDTAGLSMVEITRGLADDGKIRASQTGHSPSANWDSATGVLANGVFSTIRIEFATATYLGSNTWDTDGYFRLYVNGSIAINQPNVDIHVGAGQSYVTQVIVGTSSSSPGVIDNLEIRG